MAVDTKSKTMTSEELSEQLDTLRQDMADMGRMLATMGASKARDAKAAVQDTAAHLKADGIHYAHVAGEKADEALDMVRRQPASSVAIAVGVGFLAGLVMGRR